MPLDPEHLTPAASINRVRIVDLPGAELRPEVRGKTAYELLALYALAATVREHADELGIPAPDRLDDRALPPLLELALSSADDGVRVAAESICADHGESLGYLIATLQRGDAVNREARPEWDESYWRHWAGIQRVWLGGGLASGALGRAFEEHAMRCLRSAGVFDCEVRASVFPPFVLPLIGLARTSTTRSPTALVLDFGQTNVKSGIARFGASGVERLDILPASESPASSADVAREMRLVIADAYRRASREVHALSEEIAVSIASYVRDNHPYRYDLSTYAKLWSFTGNLGAWLGHKVSEEVGRTVSVRLEHDSTAAAQAYAGEAGTAVIMLGTALGSGFPSLVGQAMPLAQAFEVAFR